MTDLETIADIWNSLKLPIALGAGALATSGIVAYIYRKCVDEKRDYTNLDETQAERDPLPKREPIRGGRYTEDIGQDTGD